MQYKEVESWDIANKPEKVIIIITDNANHFSNDLYILVKGRNFSFDKDALNALENLKNEIEEILNSKRRK
jgi:hypothetical protein